MHEAQACFVRAARKRAEPKSWGVGSEDGNGRHRVSSFKAFTTAIAIVAIGTTAFAQQDDLRTLAANRDKKLAAGFFRCAKWTTNYDEARESAKAGNKLIFGYFTRS